MQGSNKSIVGTVTMEAQNLPERKATPERRGFRFGVDKLFLILVMLYLIVPLGATLAFGFSNGKSIDFYTIPQILNDHDFSQTLVLSLELSLAATILSVIVVTPTAYWVQMRLPQARPIMDFLALVPFAVPALSTIACGLSIRRFSLRQPPAWVAAGGERS